MDKIFLFGDTHGILEISKLYPKNFRHGHSLDKHDYVIILGDFGLILHPNENIKESRFLDWLDAVPWTTLFIDGNHENFDRLEKFPIVDKFNGKVSKINNSVFHLRRGNVYTIAEKTFFTFGGGESIDKHARILGVDWWAQEMPSHEEMERGLDAIDSVKEVDFILSHSAPATVIKSLFNIKKPNYLEKYLERVSEILIFKKWYFGHYHQDISDSSGKYHCVYNEYKQLLT